jgi:hypothetical protein
MPFYFFISTGEDFAGFWQAVVSAGDGAMTGAHPKVVQVVMRHSTITLTMDTYGHLFPGQEADAVAKLPNMMGHIPEALAAPGTDDETADPKWAQIWAQSDGKTGQDVASDGEMPIAEDENGGCDNPLPIVTLSDHWQVVASNGESRPGGI